MSDTVHVSHLLPESITNYIETEVSILKRLETSGFSWSPRLLGYDSGFETPIRFPYIVLRLIKGMPLEWSDTTPTHQESRNNILQQMVDIILELAHCTMESSTPMASLLFHAFGLLVLFLEPLPANFSLKESTARSFALAMVRYPSYNVETALSYER